ncbi:putative integral membrane protein [Babesia bovis T2Bo]|uniref:putative integral membrane protein n=1 Tax=Babesia bovis T2Bo TaxID=484906 RepID=UPI001DBFBB4B|nr:putative integral membrane protein [Babesia bovis T2Bo]KAG6439982.1 putative integral membrane protein [Babesia bovis T2Bo]
MLVYPALVLALGALWPLDWTPMKSQLLSSVTGQYHGTTWAMAEKVAGGDDPEEVVVVEGTTSDEVAKNKESQKGWKQKLKEWAIEYALLDENGHFQWDWNFLIWIPIWLGALIIGGPLALIVMLIYFIAIRFFKLINPKSSLGCGGSSVKNMNGTKLD